MVVSSLSAFSTLLSCSSLLLASLVDAASVGSVQGPSTASSFASKSYDYLIVGGGTAGLVVAARLTENPAVTVAVIEAGIYHPNDPWLLDPAQYGPAVGNDSYDWNLYTVPQVGLNNRSIQENRGKLLGGSSALNAFAWQRASAEEYDTWGNTFGNGENWTWQNIEPYFVKAENWTQSPPLVFNGEVATASLSAAHGRGGPVQVDYNNYFADELVSAVEAANNLGIPFNNNPDSGNATGFVNVARSIDPVSGNRSYAAPAYYEPYAYRTNYIVMTGAEVTKVNFKKGSGPLTATGVTFVSNGQNYTVNANREVILSAGPLKSPQILELSGIGNKTILSDLGIETLVDLPYVGENFIDHTVTFSDHVLVPGQLTLDALDWNATYAAEQEAIYKSTRQGPLSYSSASVAVVPAHNIIDADTLSTMTATLNSTVTWRTPLGKLQYESSLKMLSEGKIGWGMLIAWPGGGQASDQVNGTSYFGSHVLNYHPFSRGYVHINTTNPHASAVIDPNFMGVPFDAQFCGQELAFTQKWAATSPLSNIVAGPNTPAADALTADDLESYCRSTAITTWHPMGTTAMAPLEMGGVVDSTLKVHGLANVRVADSGIIPQTIGAALQATTFMIGEKAADIIKAAQ